MTIAGFFIGIAGLWVAISQIRKTKTAAELARQSVDDFRDEMGNLNTIEEFSKALNAIQDIKRFIRFKAYSVVPERLNEVRHSLITIRESGTDLTEEDEKQFQKSITLFKQLEDKFEAFLYDQKEQTEDPKILSKITAQADGLKALLVRIRKDMETKRNGK